jgi:hypothetical protein
MPKIAVKGVTVSTHEDTKRRGAAADVVEMSKSEGRRKGRKEERRAE